MPALTPALSRTRDRAQPGCLAREKGKRPWSFFLHSLFGLHLSLFFGFVCATGTIATVSHEIEWLLLPKVRASASAAQPASWGAMWEAARAAHPQAVFSGIGRPSSGYEDYLARVASGTRADGTSIEVYVDPAAATVTGHSIGTTFHSFMRALHYYLFAPTSIPFYAVTALGFLMLLSLVTGLIVYKKFWRGFFRWPRFDKPPRVWWGDVHRLLGLWSLWFVFAIGITSVWYMAEWAGWLEWDAQRPKLERALSPAERLMPDGARIDRWVALAQERMPGLHVTHISLPFEPEGAVTIQGQWQAWLVRERSNAVSIDPRDDRVIHVRDAQRIPITERVVHTADPLHFGDFFGLATKLIWVVFGLALVAMAASGAVVYAKRTGEATRRLARRRGVVREAAA